MTQYECLTNLRIQQILNHAGVRLVSVTPDRIVLANTKDGPLDPLSRVIFTAEPTAQRGDLHMPSLEEARAAGLIED